MSCRSLLATLSGSLTVTIGWGWSYDGAWVRGAARQMKVVEGLSGGVEPGSVVPVAELGLPVEGRKGFLIVFWKGA
jgi:hypothetical protein